METNRTMADNSAIDWVKIIELYPNAVKKVNENIGEWIGDPQITSKGVADDDGTILIPEFLLFAFEDLGLNIQRENTCKTPEEYADFYTNAFKDLN